MTEKYGTCLYIHVHVYKISLSNQKNKKNKNKTSEAGIAVYTETASTHNIDVWSTSNFIAGNIAGDHCDVKR